ncbi:kinase-like domain-containing protein [Aspergillus californicus]
MPISTSAMKTSKTRSPSRFALRDSHSDQDRGATLFSYTSGRWLWNEASQLLKRYQPFNVQELKETAARSVNEKCCVEITKLPEGSYNKTFLLTMDNDMQVIAKIPNPYIPQKLVTASEVATLEFLRTELDMSVPRVVAWSSTKDQPVGVKYIIMEKAPGSEFSKCWPAMGVLDKIDIVPQLAIMQAKIAAVDFGHFGSLFYREDIDGGIAVPGIDDRFCIGPNCDFRSSFEPHTMDIARREKEWITRFANPRHLADSLRQSDSQESPDCHIKILDEYRQVVPYLIPSDPGQNQSVLWHSDLHFGNIFVKGGHIVSIINWRGCSSLPIFHTSRIPKFLKGKEEILRRYYLTQLQRLYISKFRKADNGVFSALSELTGQPQSSCPVAFTDDELASHAAEGKDWDDRRDLFKALDIPFDGWVHPEVFEAKVEIMRNLVSLVVDSAEDKDVAKDALRAWKLSESGPASLSGNLMDI